VNDFMDFPRSRTLPPDIAIMVVDTKDFSRYRDAQQNRLAHLIPQVLEQAARDSGLAKLWTHQKFPDSTGDGFIVGFDSGLLPQVLDRYLDVLQAVLRQRDTELRAEGIKLRMRLSLNKGPVEMLKELAYGSPVGKTMIDTHRLVDAEPLRVLLDRSDPDVTFLAAAISENVIAEVVRTGYAGRKESEFVAAPVKIESKDFQGTAYLRVPVPSGDLLRYGLLGVQPGREENKDNGTVARPAPSPTPSASAAASVSVNKVSGRPRGRTVQLRDVNGGLHDHSVTTGNITGTTGVIGSVSGSGHTIVGRDIDQSHNTWNAGGDQYHARGDMAFGLRVSRSQQGGADEAQDTTPEVGA